MLSSRRDVSFGDKAQGMKHSTAHNYSSFENRHGGSQTPRTLFLCIMILSNCALLAFSISAYTSSPLLAENYSGRGYLLNNIKGMIGSLFERTGLI